MIGSTHKSKVIFEGENKSVLGAVDGITRKVGTAERQLQGFGKGLGGTLGSITSLVNPTLAITAAVAGAAASFGMMIKNSIDTADQLSKMSQKVGVSTEELSTLSYAARLSDVELSGLETSLGKLNRNVLDASNGLGEAKRGFENLGISLVDVNNKTKQTDQLLLEISDKFKDLPDGATKTGLAMQLMGRSGADMIPLLNQGTEGIKNMQQAARDLGLEVSAELGQKAETFNDAMTQFSATIEGLAIKVLPALIDPLIDLTYYLNNFSFENLIKSTTVEGMVEISAQMALYRIELENTIKLETERRIKQQEENEINNDIKSQIKAAENLEKQWQSTLNSLNQDISTAGLSKMGLEFVKIDNKVADLYAKFGNKAAISEWAEAMKVALIDVSSISVQASIDYSTPDITKQLQPIEFDTTFYDLQKEQITQVTVLEMANYAMRSGAAEDMFSNMSGAAYSFFEQGKKQSKAAFAIYKATSMAQVGISTYLAAAAALEPPPTGLGPIWGIPLAASVIASGLARVSQIGGMSPGNGGGGGGGYSVPSATPANNVNTNNNNNQQIYITIQSDYQDPDDLVRKLVPALEKYTSYGGNIKIG